MLKKSTVAVITAMATALSALSPLTVNAISIPADIDSAVKTIPSGYTRIYANAPQEQIQTTTTNDYEWVQTEPTENTIKNRVYTLTTVPVKDDTQGIFPVTQSRDLTVRAIDSETGESVEGVQVKLVETETPTSNYIKRDFGTWCSSDSESFTLNDVSYTLENNSSMFILTAVLEHIPDGYSYKDELYGTKIIDHIVDFGEWHANDEEAYHDTNTLTIELDKTYSGTFNAECSVINSDTGEIIEGAEVALVKWYSDGDPQSVETWSTESNASHVINNLEYTLPSKSSSELWEFVVNRLPDEYNNNMISGLSYSANIDINTPDTVEFKIYVDPDGKSVGNTNTRPPQYIATTTAPPASLDINNTTVATTTASETRACEHCGKVINVSDGINTPLGMFVCIDCRALGIGGTRPRYPEDTQTTTQTTVSDGNTIIVPNTTSVAEGLYHGSFQAVCFAIDITTGKRVNDMTLELYIPNQERTIETWESSDKCGHQISVDYTMEADENEIGYQLGIRKLPDGYKSVPSEMIQGLIPNYNTIERGFNGTVSFAVYVAPEDYSFSSGEIEPPKVTGTTPSEETPVMTVTSLAVGKIELNSTPTKTVYNIGEELDLTGLDVSMTYELGVNGKDGSEIIFNHVNPVDYPKAFIVNTHEFDSTKAGTYTIKVKCSDDYKAQYTVINNILTFTVTVRGNDNGTVTYGDVNCDDKVSLADAVLIMQALSNPNKYKLSEQGKINADVYNTGDGITPIDALTIQEVSLQIISTSDLPLSR
ncbi:MAG: bacterial Ig-like domain-containing protein [Ruminococcus flavefaciens]|nr:bacterial Ig-like domain-containing protein [Ruminococcus flavefaciens]